jgi:THO complex subunit 4
MRIELVVDPSKPLPLASRVAPAAKAAAAAAKAGAPRRRRGARRNERPAKSAADLDAEMEDYTLSNAPAATAA